MMNTILSALLFIVSACIIAVPELRTSAMEGACTALFVGVAFFSVRRAYKHGLFRLTPRQIMELPDRGKWPVLSSAALLVGSIALMF